MYLIYKTRNGQRISRLNLEEYKVMVENQALYSFINEPYQLEEQTLQMNMDKKFDCFGVSIG